MKSSRLLRLLTSWLLLFLHAAFVVADEPPKPKPPTEEELREAEVYDAIAEMIKRRDQLLRKFAVVLSGEVTTFGENGPSVKPLVLARVTDERRSFDLKSEFVILEGQFASGSETLRIGTKYKCRDFRAPFVKPYVEKPPEINLKEWLEVNTLGAGVDPFDDYAIGAGTFIHGGTYRQIEEQVLKSYKLVSAERGVGGKLIANWTANFGKLKNSKIVWEFDPAVDMMLVRNHADSIDQPDWFKENRIEWKRHGKSFVPNRIQVAYQWSPSHPERLTEYAFKCYWLIGDEVPDVIYESDDPLAALMDHWKIPHAHVINGEAVHVFHQVPKDLYQDVPVTDSDASAGN